MKDKIAILGAGASGFGTYLGLIKSGYTDSNIDIYNSPNKNKIRYNIVLSVYYSSIKVCLHVFFMFSSCFLHVQFVSTLYQMQFS